ncbi:MAG: hypothetical protein ABSD75_06715 [Terriglobales bacterium]
MKRVSNLLHLLTGVALLVTAIYFFRQLADGGKTMWQQQSFGVAPRSAQSGSASEDAVQGMHKLEGAPDQAEEGAGGDGALSAATSGPPALLDHVNSTVDTGAPNHFLHRRFSLETYQFFPFEVPLHAIRPELQGTFRSLAAQNYPDGDLPVEVWLMNAEEFARFVNHRAVIAEFSSKPSSRGEIYWKLEAPAGRLQKYYLVFRNPSDGQRPTIVDADFTASFE